jgi:DNA invertase Pin-like site-specific DNA recombinase
MNYGFANGSTAGHDLQTQVDHLKNSGCESIFIQSTRTLKSGAEFREMNDQLRVGDCVTVYCLDVLNLSTLDLIKLMVRLNQRGVSFRSITEGLDNSSNDRHQWYFLCKILLQNERSCASRKKKLFETKAVAKKGRGRPCGLSEEKKLMARIVLILHENHQEVADICKVLTIGSFSTFYKYLAYAQRERLMEKKITLTYSR